MQPMKAIKPFIITAGIVGTLILAGCATLQLERFHEHAKRGDDRWIAAQVIDCNPGSDVCNQLHLIKGAACLRVARSSHASVEAYRCAADELTVGLAQQRSWSDPSVHRRLKEDLCESLQGLYARQRDDAAETTLARLVEAAEALYQLAPESIPAVYYLAHARLRQLQRKLPGLAVFDRLPVCNRLKRTLMSVLTTMETAESTPSADYQRLVAHYERLAFELGAAVAAADCR